MSNDKKWRVESTSDTKTLKTVCDEIYNASKGGSGIKLDPEYQREYKFTQKDESLLIESILMGIPIPVIYLSSDICKVPHVANVIDGQHRLRAVYRFLDNKFALKGLEKIKELNDKKFKDLDNETQNKLLYQSSLSFENIHVQDNPELEMEIFKRYNQGTHPLSKQEIRHAVYRSDFNLWINMKVDEYFKDNILKEIYNISKNRYSDKSAHEALYVMLEIINNGLNNSFGTSPEYAENFMQFAVKYSNQAELIKENDAILCKVNRFLVKIYKDLGIQYPFSKEIYGVINRNYKLQTPILMIVSAFLKYLIERDVSLDNDSNINKIISSIKDVLQNSHLEKPFKGSNTRPKLLIDTVNEIVKVYETRIENAF